MLLAQEQTQVGAGEELLKGSALFHLGEVPSVSQSAFSVRASIPTHIRELNTYHSFSSHLKQ